MTTTQWFRNLIDVLNEEQMPQLNPEQLKLLEPYKQVDPADGSTFYAPPTTDPKEVGAGMQPTQISPAAIASMKRDQPKIIAQLLGAAAAPVQQPTATVEPQDDTPLENVELESVLKIAGLK